MAYYTVSEDRETAGDLLDLGFYISFPGIVTFRVMRSNCAMLRVMSPWIDYWWKLTHLTLRRYRIEEKENQPAMVRDVAEYMAVLKGVAVEELAQVTTDNFARLFHIDASAFNPSVE
ncbi:TatD family hydrolase [Escherichia coli]